MQRYFTESGHQKNILDRESPKMHEQQTQFKLCIITFIIFFLRLKHIKMWGCCSEIVRKKTKRKRKM